VAIIFTTGTINAPDAGSVGLAMVEKIRDDLVAHVAWELVEEFTPSGGAVRWHVFKCLATESGLPVDFFVIMGRTLGDGSIRAFICEGYNSTTHVASLYASHSSGSLVYAFTALGYLPHTYTLGLGALSTANTLPKYSVWAPSGVSTKWWLTVTEDGFTVAFNGAVNGYMHFGVYIPLTSMPIAMPLSMIDSVSLGAVTRNPAAANGSFRSDVLLIGSHVGLGFAGRLDLNDKLQADLRPIAELGITVDEGLTGGRVNTGWALGKMKRIRIGSNPPAGFAFGDAYAFQGRLWVPYHPTHSWVWDTGVAV